MHDRAIEIIEAPHTVKLHVGCGPRNFGEEWVHLDGGYHKHVDIQLVGTEIVTLSGAPKPADIIYASHLLEYFDWQDGIKLLKAWRDRLNVGGIIRLSVPDFSALCDLYFFRGSLQDIIGPLFGRMLMNGRAIHHKSVYDTLTLRRAFVAAGFKQEEIREWAWPDKYAVKYDDYAQAMKHGRHISLNIEAEKGAS